MSKRLLITLCACLFLGAGCNLIYKQNIQQGNALEQDDLNQLELGMTKNQVSFLLGTPAIHDPFHHDRWDFISTFSRRGGEPVRRLVTLEFEDDRLATMRGVDPNEGQVVLTGDGAEQVTAATALPGVAVEDARDYEDLQLVPEDFDHWTLQVGSFSSRSAANIRLGQLQDKGIEAKIWGQVIGNTGFFVVRSGEFATRAEALVQLERIEGLIGSRVFLVTPGS